MSGGCSWLTGPPHPFPAIVFMPLFIYELMERYSMKMNQDYVKMTKKNNMLK